MVIAEGVWRHLNRWDGKPCAVGLEALPKGGMGMMVQQLAGTVVEKRFVDGGFVGRWPFAVVMRVAAGATDGRLMAVGCLAALADWLKAAGLPELGEGRQALKVEMASLPSKAAAYPDGTEDYQAVFALQYREERGHE